MAIASLSKQQALGYPSKAALEDNLENELNCENRGTTLCDHDYMLPSLLLRDLLVPMDTNYNV